MNAGGPESMRDAIARIIDPHAFNDSRWDAKAAGIQAKLQAAARTKADQVIALEFSFEQLPADLQEAVELLAGGPSGKDALEASLAAFAPMRAEDGAPLYTGLVRPQRDGSLLLAIMTDDGGDDDEKASWIVESLADDRSRALAAQLQVLADGGGTA